MPGREPAETAPTEYVENAALDEQMHFTDCSYVDGS